MNQNKSFFEGKEYKHLQYADQLGYLENILLEKFSEREDCQAYRTVQEVPPNMEDQTPRDLRDNNTGPKMKYSFPEKLIRQMPENKQIKLAGKIGLSVNDSLEAAINSCLKTYKTKKDNGADEEELMAYRESRGSFVIRLNINNTNAIITEFVNHHANLFLYEGVSLEDIRDKTFAPVQIPYDKS